jgi:hypothetical protein
MQPMGRLSNPSKWLDFFLFEVLKGGEEGFFSIVFVPNMFPIRFPLMCSPRVVPIAPRFNPICFAQSPPLVMYVGGPKDEALHLSIEAFILGSLHSFNFVL